MTKLPGTITHDDDGGIETVILPDNRPSILVIKNKDALPEAEAPTPREPRDSQATGFDPREREGMAEAPKGETGTSQNVAREPLDPTHGHQYGVTEGVSLDEIRNWRKS